MFSYIRSNLLSSDAIDGHVPASWCIDNVIINRDMSLAGGFQVELPPFFTTGEDDQEKLYGILASFLNTLDPRIELQWVWETHRETADIIAQFKKREPKSEVMRAMDRETLDNLQERKEAGILRRYRAHVFLTLSPKYSPVELKKNWKRIEKERKRTGFFVDQEMPGSRLLDMLGFGPLDPEANSYTADEWGAQTDLINGALDVLGNTLEDLGVAPVRYSTQDLVTLLWKWWNPGKAEMGDAPPTLPMVPTPVTDLILTEPLKMDRKTGTMQMGDAYHSVVSLRTPPSEMRMNTFAGLLQSYEVKNLRMVVNMRHYDRNKRISDLTRRLPQVESRIASEPAYEVVSMQMRSEILRLQQGQEACWATTIMLHTWESDLLELDRAVSEIRRQGKSCGNATFAQETYGMWNYFLACQPGWTRDVDTYRTHTLSTSQVVCLLPFNGHPEQINEPICSLLETQNGSVYNLNLMDTSRMENCNTLITGTSGTGKSFLTGSVLMGTLSKQPKITVIDLGGSYSALCESQHGTYINFDLQSKRYCVNPLQIASDMQMPTESDMDQIIRWLEKACAESGKEFAKEEKGMLESLVTATYAKVRPTGNMPILSDLRDICNAQSSEFAVSMGKRLQPFVTTYANLYNGPTSVDFNANFLVFDLQAIGDNNDIGPLAIMSIIHNVKQSAVAPSNIQKEKYLVLDEAWKLLQDPASAKFVCECFRTFRKFNVGIIGVSQGVGDWQVGGDPNAILNNVTSYLILKQASVAALRQVAALVGINSEELGIVAELKKKSGEFSEFLLVQSRQNGKFSTVLVNRTSPLQYAIMTTRPKDKAAMERLRKERHLTSTLEARIEFAKIYPKGVA